MNITLFRDFVEDKRTSMEVYADNLLEHLPRLAEHALIIQQYRPYLSGLVHTLPQQGNLRMRFARYIGYPLQARKHQGEINHILDHGYAHLLRVLDPHKTVVTVHDIIPVLAGQGKIPGVERQRRSRLSEYSASFLKKAAHIIAVSQNTKQDLVDYCGCNANRITVSYSGIDPLFRSLSGGAQKKQCRHGLDLPEDETRLLLITGAEFYKNQETSLQVFGKLRNRCQYPLKLVRLGRMTRQWQICLQASSYRDHIIHFENLSPEDMVRLYNAVDCLLFPSWYEGFGWPPLEAMACGTPVVVSDRASLPEAVGSGAIICAAENVDGLTANVQRLLEDGIFRKQQIERGMTSIQRFNWANNAQEVFTVYTHVMQMNMAN